MTDSIDRAQARRVFEETLATMQAEYQAPEDFMVEAVLTNDAGEQVVVARYKIFVDGHFECFELLDDVLWPSL